MIIKNLFSCLNEDLQHVMLRHQNQEIYNLKFLLKEHKQFDAHTLYIGRTSSLDPADPSPIPAFLGIKDCNISLEQLSSRFTNYAFLKNDSNLYNIFNKVQDIIWSEQTYLRSSSILLQSLIKGKGLQYIIDIGYQLLNNPMLLVDSSYKLLAYTKKDKVDDRVWNELVTRGYCSHDLISIFRKEGVVEKIAKSDEPLLTDSGFSEKIRRIHGKIIINNKLVGYLGVLEYNQKFKEEDFNTIKLLCDVISEEMQKNKNYYYTKGLMYESLLIDLLDNSIQNWEHVRERLKAAGLKLENNLFLAVINFIHEDISNYHLVDYLRDYIDNQLHFSKSIFYNNQIVVFLSLKDDQVDSSMSTLEKCLKDNDLQGGVSDRFKTIMDIKKAYLQAQKALELGKCLFNSRNLYKYWDYRIYHILQLAGERHKLADLVHPAPLTLKQYDVKNETDTYQTLYTYLCTNKNIKDAADKIFIHRNTMKYRLKQIKEIAGINLDNFEECVQIYLSYKILDLINFMPDGPLAKVSNFQPNKEVSNIL